MFKQSPMKTPWFIVPMEYNPNGNGIIALMENTLMVHSPNGKGIVVS